MWLFTTLGFYSVVADRDDASRVLVRARARADLEALVADHLPGAQIVEHAGSDYRFRVIVPRREWERAARELAARLDYPNFKDAVAARQGHGRADLYLQVWSLLRRLQRRGGEA